MPAHPPQNPTHIRPGQVWASARPMEVTTVRVVYVGLTYVEVVDAHDGKRARRIRPTSFHASPTTWTGQPRKSGYVLKTDAPADRECLTPWHTHDDPTTITNACQIPPTYECNSCGDEWDDDTGECCEDGEIVPAEYDEVAQ